MRHRIENYFLHLGSWNLFFTMTGVSVFTFHHMNLWEDLGLRMFSGWWLEVLITAVFLAVIHAFYFLPAVERKRPFILYIPIFLLTIFILAYTFSWGQFITMGAFADMDSIRFGLGNGIQIILHLFSLSSMSVVILLALFFVPFIGNKLITSYFKRVDLRIIAAIHFIVFVVFATLGVWNRALPAKARMKDQDGQNWSVQERIDVLHRDELGPSSFLFQSLFMNGEQDERSFVSSDLIEAEYVPRTYRYEARLPEKPKNVIVLILESLRPDQLMSFGGRRSAMPTIDALASSSLTFQRTYTNASHSNYADICPLSSQYPLRSHRQYFYPRLSPYPKTLIYDDLKSLGYKTAFISSQNENWGRMKFFLESPSLDLFFHSESSGEATYISTTDTGFQAWIKKNNVRSGKLDDATTVQRAIAWVQENQRVPFFLSLNLQSSHVPFVMPENFERKFSQSREPLNIWFGKYPSDQIEAVKDQYSDSLYYMDSQIARLFDELKKLDIWENTVIVVLGDQGTAFGEHNVYSHASSLYEPVARVPLIVKVPGKAPQRIKRLTELIDVPSIILAQLNLPPHLGYQGQFLSESEEKSFVFLTAQTNIIVQFGVVAGRYKLLHTPRKKKWELFDTQIDPEEKNNLIAVKPEVFRILKEILAFWKSEQLRY
ncbi:MAG: sulfatase, partial [Pseudobdellovibrionaceae bacterium]